MLKEQDSKSKFVPLRRFANKNLYDMPYLSILVQRGKLKAKKIGRNYFTTEEWFSQYLQLHARDEKRGVYKKVEQRKTKKLNILTFLRSKTMVLTVVFLVALIISLYFIIQPVLEKVDYLISKDVEQGEVAGTSETYVDLNTDRSIQPDSQ